MKIKSKFWIAAIAFALSSSASAEVLFNIYGSGYVYEASDGDTFWINVDRKDTFDQLFMKSKDRRHFRPAYTSVKMRLGNVNTAESNHKNKSRNTAEGVRASKYIKGFVEKKRVEFHCWDIGRYGRPICSIDVKGLGDIGLFIIERGLSPYVTKFGKSPRMHDAYSEAAINNK